MEGDKMARIRPAQHQGTFYPADAAILNQQLDWLLDHAALEPNPPIKAIVSPHAGYDYSGRVAGMAYAALQGQSSPQRVVILAPNHQQANRLSSICDYTHFATPLGEVAVDQAFIQQHWAKLPHVQQDNRIHQAEYSIEVQLPFIQRCLPGIPIAPILLGQGNEQDITDIIQPAWDDPRTLIVISSDLYHYQPRAAALALGLHTSLWLEDKQYTAITPERACGYAALRGVMQLAQQQACYWRTLAIQHSGQANRFQPHTLVGYGAFVLVTPHPSSLSGSSYRCKQTANAQ